MLIDIEGTDGSGKALQTKKLYDYLVSRGYNCLLVSFPNYESRSSEPVKMYLDGEVGDNVNCLDGYQASSLYAVDRMLTFKKLDLEGVDFILLDRYTPSNMIHQSTRIDDENKMCDFLEWVEDFEYNKMSLPRPDRILFLDMPPKFSIQLAHNRAILKNGQSKDIHEKDSEHLSKAYNRAKYVANKYNWTTIRCIDNDKIRAIEDIHAEIVASLNL